MPDQHAGLIVEHPSDGVVRLLLDRPERRNAIDETMVDALTSAFADAHQARAIVVGSNGANVFCAGADLQVPDDERARISGKLYALYEAMITHPAVIVAALDGPAVGGGAQLAIAADLRVVSGSARFRFVGPRHGLAVGAWGLPSLVGRGQAMRLCLTGADVDADQALAIGLAEQRVGASSAIDGATRLADQLTELDATAARNVKRIVTAGAGLVDAVRAEAHANSAWSGIASRS